MLLCWDYQQKDAEMEIKIDKNVELSPSMTGRSKKSKYPFAELEIGDSFFVEGKTAGQFGGWRNYHRPKKFSERTVIENGVKGLRVWRIA